MMSDGLEGAGSGSGSGFGLIPTRNEGNRVVVMYFVNEHEVEHRNRINRHPHLGTEYLNE